MSGRGGKKKPDEAVAFEEPSPGASEVETPATNQSMEGQQGEKLDSIRNCDMLAFMDFVRQSFVDLNVKVDKITTSQESLEKKLAEVAIKAETNEREIKDLQNSLEFNAANIKDNTVRHLGLIILVLLAGSPVILSFIPVLVFFYLYSFPSPFSWS